MANFYGIESIEFIWHGTQSDPEIEYKGEIFNYWDVEDALFSYYIEEKEDGLFSGEFLDWVATNHETTRSMLDDWILARHGGL